MSEKNSAEILAPQLELFRGEIKRIKQKMEERAEKAALNDALDTGAISQINTEELQEQEMYAWNKFKEALQALDIILNDLSKESLREAEDSFLDVEDKLVEIKNVVMLSVNKENNFFNWLGGKVTPFLSSVDIILSDEYPFEKKGIESISKDVKEVIDLYVK